MTSANTQIYPNKKNQYEREIARLKKWASTSYNKQVITDFHNHLFSTGSGEQRVAKLSGQMRRISLLLNKNFNEVTKKDAEKVIAYYNRQGTLSPDTKADYIRCIKQFYSYFEDEDDRLKISVTTRSSQELEEKHVEAKNLYKYLSKVSAAAPIKKIPFELILTDEDIDQVVEQGCETLKQKAMIKFLHESGARVGELLSMKIQDFKHKGQYAMVKLDGKTGVRNIPITNSIPYLIQYLSIHPYKNNSHSYLWMGESRRYGAKPMTHAGAQKLINTVFSNANLADKKHNFHWFRHSRATLLGQNLTEAMLCKYMGWEIGSKQPRRYLHSGEAQLEETYLDLKGVEHISKKLDRKPRVCSCGILNDTIAKYCYGCGKPLAADVVLTDQADYNAEMDKSISLLMEIVRNPALMAQFEAFKRKMNL